MFATPEVLIHDLTDGYWPEDVAELLGRLSRPLPKRLASDDVWNAIPPCHWEVYDEALRSSILLLESDMESEISVTDVVDTVLTSVSMVKAASSFGRGHQQAGMSWTSLIAILGIAISEDVFIAEDTPFLMARTRTRPRSQVFEGKAGILLSILLPRCPRDKGAEKSCRDSDSMAYFDNGSTVSEDSFETLDIPLYAHVDPGRGKRVDCRMPVVCAADEDEIEALVTSVVCQRHVWNITLPVVGVSISKSGTTVRIVIGWAEVDVNSQDGTPVIHLAFSQKTGDLHPSLGLFDLMDPASALYFGQFILSLRPSFSYIRSCLKDRKMRDFCWRLDHNILSDPPSPGTDDNLSVDAWLRGCLSAENADTSAPLSDQGNVMVKKSASSASPTPSAAYLQVPQAATANSDASSNGDSNASNQLGSKRSRYSASAFAKLNPRNGLAAMEIGTDTWLWDRRTIRLHRVKLFEPMSVLGVQINDMIELYDRLTEFCWPVSWTNTETAPGCDKVYKGLRNRLFEDYEAYRNSAKSESELSESDKEDDIFSSVASHMSILLKSVANAEVGKEQTAFKGATESAMRSAWDDILKATCCPPEHAQSKSFFFEKTIPLPQNQAVANGDEFKADTQARLLYDLLSYQDRSCREYPAPIRDSVWNALAHSVANIQAIKANRYSPTSEDRKFEPSTAIVDGVYCLKHVPAKEPALPRKQLQKKVSQRLGWLSSLMAKLKKPTKNGRCKKGRDEVFEYVEPDKKQERRLTYNSAHLKCVMCSDVTESLRDPSPSSPPSNVPANLPEVYIPFLFAEYKRGSAAIHQAVHQIQMYCITGVEILASIGITDFPVWGVVTSGTEGEIVMAWKSSKPVEDRQLFGEAKVPLSVNPTEYNFIIDQNCRRFDLTKPLQAFHFMISMHRIYQQQEVLRERLDPQYLFHCPSDLFREWMLAEPKLDDDS